MELFQPDFYQGVLLTMTVLAIIVFIALHKITAGYGMMYTSRWGATVNNRLGWVLMEAPVFVAMLALWLCSDRQADTARVVIASLFMLHYLQRSFIFPLLIRGRGRMPLAIIAMGVIFNIINAYMLGGWIFYLSPADYYTLDWLTTPQFILGTIIFFAGMAINWHSDYIIRHLRRPGDTRHYIPRGGMFRFVTSANYLGEFTEWLGYAILTWSAAGAVFALWTFANLAPRAVKLHNRYCQEFGDEYRRLNRHYILPFIY
jgi:3-oxo-5-alpha-steroid 4-dehydrogenase 1